MDISKLNKIQKVKLVMGADFWSNDTADGSLYKFVLSDGPVGLRQPLDKSNPEQKEVIKSVAYPSAQVLSQTWNCDLAKLLGKSIGNDCIEQKVDIVLGPGVNIKRLPTNGRNFEYYSEDPYLAGTLAKKYIEGVQEMHVGTCIKHFCCNNSEFSRHWASMEVDERTLHEIYLKAFEIAMEAKPWTVMCSYNLVNGRRMSENNKLYNVLRNNFKFDGLIMSDWDAVKDSEASLNAGLNLEMPYNENHHNLMMKKAQENILNERKLDESAVKVIELAEKCEKESKLRKMDMSINERRNVALKIAEEGIVLLKNENNVLPLKHEKKIFVTGDPTSRYYCGGGSSQVCPELPFISLEEALKAECDDVQYYESIWEKLGHLAHVGNAKKALEYSAQAEYTILAVGDSANLEFECADREGIKLSKEEEILINDFAKVAKHLIIVVEAGSAIDMSSWIDKVEAVVYMGYGGELGHKALANILVGKINPSGRLSETFPLKLEDSPAMKSYHDSSVMKYDEGLNIGYRYYETFNVPVLFPFGYGLSYSKFEYSNLKIEQIKDVYKVSFDIENETEIDGAEVCQLYIREVVKEVYRPDYELKGYEKIFIKAHEKKKVIIELKRKDFAYYSTYYDEYHVKPGAFDILIGKNSHDIILKERIIVD